MIIYMVDLIGISWVCVFDVVIVAKHIKYNTYGALGR